jgi:hypothetical protein
MSDETAHDGADEDDLSSQSVDEAGDNELEELQPFDPRRQYFDKETGEPITYEQWRATWRPQTVRHDWPAIRARFVEGYTGDDGEHVWPTLGAVADHFNAGVQGVRARSGREGWVAQRAEWQAQVEAERRRNKVTELAKAADKLDGRALNAAELGIQLCVTRLVEIGRAVETRRQSSGVDFGTAVEAREMQALAAATDLWHKIGLRAVGDVEALRLQLIGANGQPLDIGAELVRDNPERLGGVVAVLKAAGLGEFFAGETLQLEPGE